jgi:excisionase family DNA binding protein
MADIVTANELKNCLKLSKSTIYKLASVGVIPGFRIGDSWRFDMNDIQKLIRGEDRQKRKGICRSCLPP